MTKDENGESQDYAPLLSKALGMTLENPPKKSVQIDVAKYQAWLDDPELSDGQKLQVVESLWQIILCFVDLGFQVSPWEDACGKLAENQGSCGHAHQDVLESKAHTLSDTFNHFAGS